MCVVVYVIFNNVIVNHISNIINKDVHLIVVYNYTLISYLVAKKV